MDTQTLASLNDSLRDAGPREIIQALLPLVGKTAMSFSGAEDVVLIEHATRAGTQIPEVFTLDTGRLHSETLRYLEVVRLHYKLRLEVLSPDAATLAKFVADNGLFSFYEHGHTQCCQIRKVAPLRRHLAGFEAWITGQRRDQSPTRSAIPIIEVDTAFSTPDRQLLKINPLANTSSADVWNTIRLFDIPYNALHDRGFVSIGCEPCTRAVGPNQHEREGRWWWEEATQKECGLHRPERLEVR